MGADRLVTATMVIGILALILVPLMMDIYGDPSAGKLIIVGLSIIAAATILMISGLGKANRMEYCLERTRQRADIMMALALWGFFVLIIIVIFFPRLLKAMVAA
ncbi:hypothetical protein JXA12_02970 [Candidatus Woesearchaeota archaeon]|nr:hypothetical protein [Candidatus Woesearchaeota archaeon]